MPDRNHLGRGRRTRPQRFTLRTICFAFEHLRHAFFKIPFTLGRDRSGPRRIPTGIFTGRAGASWIPTSSPLFTEEDLSRAVEQIMPELFLIGSDLTVAAMEGGKDEHGFPSGSRRGFPLSARRSVSDDHGIVLSDDRYWDGHRNGTACRIGGALHRGTIGPGPQRCPRNMQILPGAEAFCA